MEEQLRALIERHCVTIREYVDAIGQLLTRISEPSSSRPEALTEAESLAHQLKGSSGSIGFPDVSTAATALDNHLKYLCASDGTMTEEEQAKLLDLYGELRRISAGISPESSTLYGMTISPKTPQGTLRRGS
jgi:HPt (histidine-containing phosphotransfer) domain-containing protein